MAEPKRNCIKFHSCQTLETNYLSAHNQLSIMADDIISGICQTGNGNEKYPHHSIKWLGDKSLGEMAKINKVFLLEK